MRPITVPLGTYVPGPSPLHSLPAGAKFFGLVLFVLSSVFLATTPLIATGYALLAFIGYVVARIPWRIALSQLLPVFPVLLFLGAFQWWQRGLDFAAAMVISLLASVAAACLLTLSTTVAELLDAIDSTLRPLARFGLPVDTISLAISLTLRLIPLMLATTLEVLAARKARGVGFSVVAFGTPVLVRSIRRARALAEALIARGAAD